MTDKKLTITDIGRTIRTWFLYQNVDFGQNSLVFTFFDENGQFLEISAEVRNSNFEKTESRGGHFGGIK